MNIMPRKIRQLKADLRRADFREVKKRGKGSHSMWRHPLVPDPVILSGQDGADARDYQESLIEGFVDRARAAMRAAEEGQQS